MWKSKPAGPAHLILTVLLLMAGLCAQGQGTWTQRADFGGGVRYGAVAFSIGAKGYLGTGQGAGMQKDFWEYDPVSDAWAQKADLGGSARRYAVGFSIGGKGYLGTGVASDGRKKDFWEYDPALNAWGQKADCGGPVRVYGVGFSIGGKGYVGTGFNQFDEDLQDFWEYDPATNLWTQKADLGGVARDGAVGFRIGSKGYVGTGYNEDELAADFWEYDPVANVWVQKADFAGGGRYNACGFSVGGKGYLGTGNDDVNLFADYWEYDPGADTWTAVAAFGGGVRQRAAGFVIGDIGFVATGNSPAATGQVWMFSMGQAVLCSADTGPFCMNGTGGPSVNFLAVGNYAPGNVFTAQLSDANGSFAAPVNIGSLGSVSSGTIACTIPAGTAVGAGYRVRVVSSDPVAEGADNGADIMITSSVPPAPVITVGGPVEFCAGGSVMLNVQMQEGYEYQWYRNGEPAPDETGSDWTVDQGGAYTVEAVNACGASMSAPVVVTVAPAPVHAFSQTQFGICNGQEATLTAVDQSTSGALIYQWWKDGEALDGEDDLSLVTDSPGVYVLEVTDTENGCQFVSPELTVSMGVVPSAGLLASGLTTFCEGNGVLMNALSNNPQATFTWFLNGEVIPGVAVSSYTAYQAGQYGVVATSPEGCASAPSSSVQVTVLPLPEAPVIHEQGDTLFASGSGNFQWYLLDSEIEGATGAFLVPAVNGVYSVGITDPNGCGNMSGPYTYVSMGIPAVEQGPIMVFPNPGDGVFHVQWTPQLGETLPFAVLDASGRITGGGVLAGPQAIVDLSGTAPGMYVLRLEAPNGVQSVRLIKR